MIETLLRRLIGRKPDIAVSGEAAAGEAAAGKAAESGQDEDDRATEADVLACFRLLLGRAPNTEERRGHMMQVGQALPSVVKGYLTSLEFMRKNRFQPGENDAIEIAKRDGYRMYASPDDALVGRHVLAGQYEPEVEAVFRRLLRPAMGVVDIGANIGVFALLSAHLVGPAGHVLAIEPNPANARMLEASRRLNGFTQLTTVQVAAGRETGLLLLHTTHSNGTTSTPEDDLQALLRAQTVPCIAVDALVNPNRRVDLIKLDVEGAEYNALLGAAGLIERDRPTIVSEFNPRALQVISGIDGPAYLRFLCGMGYGLGVIEEDGRVTALGGDVDAVMATHAARESDHIDILATASERDDR